MDYEFIDDAYSVMRDLEEENESDDEDQMSLTGSEVMKYFFFHLFHLYDKQLRFGMKLESFYQVVSLTQSLQRQLR